MLVGCASPQVRHAPHLMFLYDVVDVNVQARSIANGVVNRLFKDFSP